MTEEKKETLGDHHRDRAFLFVWLICSAKFSSPEYFKIKGGGGYAAGTQNKRPPKGGTS